MPPENGSEEGASLAGEILKQLPLADKAAVWGTLGTVRPHPHFAVDKDVQILLEAVTGKGVECQTIINLLTNRSNRQRQCIAAKFQEFTKQDLIRTLEAAVPRNLESIIVGLMSPVAQYDAHEIRTALKASEGDTLTEILATRPNQQLRETLDYYKRDFKSDLEGDLTSETSGFFQALLLALITGNREKYSGVIDYALIEEDTKALGDDRDEVDESKWIRILTHRSPEHLNRVFNWYYRMTGLQVEEAMMKHFQGNAQASALTLASVVRNTPLYFAVRIHQAIKGPGRTSERALARILISRSETDLLSIRTEFRKFYGISLYSFIQAETEGDHQAALLDLCRAEDI